MKCKNCKKNSLIKIVKIGKQPLSGFFYKTKKKNLKKYSLDLFKCSKCSLVQLNNTANTKKMYGEHYGYKTSISNMMIRHFKNKIKKLDKSKILKRGDKILDIGSNDGTFLKLLGKKYSLYGMDPSAKKFKKNYKGMTLITDFFSRKKIIEISKKKEIKFNLISSFAIFYDVKDPNSFCKDINGLLDDNGVWVCEFSYLPLMLKNLTFDQICHEHLMYYTFSVFEKILNNNNLKAIDVSINEINGGSLEVVIAKKNSIRPVNFKAIKELKKDEKTIKENSYTNFSKRIKKVKFDLKKFVDNNYPVAGYGASTKGNIVLNYTNLDENKIPYICDANHSKFGKFTPGSNIKIISKKKMRSLNPKNMIVFIWSFRSEVIKEEESYIKNGGNLIFHLPKFHIINKRNYKRYINKDFKELSYKY